MFGLSAPFPTLLHAAAQWRQVAGGKLILAAGALGLVALQGSGVISDALFWVLSMLLVVALFFTESALLGDDIEECTLTTRLLSCFSLIVLSAAELLRLFYSQPLRAQVPLVILAYLLFGLCVSWGRSSLRHARIPNEMVIGERLVITAGDCIAADVRVVEGSILVEGYGSPAQRRWVHRGAVVCAGERCVEGSGSGTVLRATEDSLWGRIREYLGRDVRSGSKSDHLRYHQIQGLLLGEMTGAVTVAVCAYTFSLVSLPQALDLAATLSCIWVYPTILPLAYLLRIRLVEVLACKGILVRRSALLEELPDRRTLLFEAPLCGGAIVRTQFRPSPLPTGVAGEWLVAACKQLLSQVTDPFMFGLREQLSQGKVADADILGISLDRVLPGTGVRGRVNGISLTIGTKDLVQSELEQDDLRSLADVGARDLLVVYGGRYSGVFLLDRSPFPITRIHTAQLRRFGLMPLLLGMGESAAINAYGEAMGFESREIFSARTAEQKQELFMSFQPAITVSAADSKWIRNASLSISPLDEVVQDLELAAVTILRGGGEQIGVLLATSQAFHRTLRVLTIAGWLATVASWVWICIGEPPTAAVISVQAGVVVGVCGTAWLFLRRL